MNIILLVPLAVFLCILFPYFIPILAILVILAIVAKTYEKGEDIAFAAKRRRVRRNRRAVKVFDAEAEGEQFW